LHIQPGEIYGKQYNQQFVMYHVIKVKKDAVTLQNIDNPLSQFETTHHKLSRPGYIRISQTPYVDRKPIKQKNTKHTKISRIPFPVELSPDHT